MGSWTRMTLSTMTSPSWHSLHHCSLMSETMKRAVSVTVLAQAIVESEEAWCIFNPTASYWLTTEWSMLPSWDMASITVCRLENKWFHQACYNGNICLKERPASSGYGTQKRHIRWWGTIRSRRECATICAPWFLRLLLIITKWPDDIRWLGWTATGEATFGCIHSCVSQKTCSITVTTCIMSASEKTTSELMERATSKNRETCLRRLVIKLLWVRNADKIWSSQEWKSEESMEDTTGRLVVSYRTRTNFLLLRKIWTLTQTKNQIFL